MALKHEIVIATRRPRLRRALTAAIVALLALGAWGLYSYTRATTISDFEKAQNERDRLLAERREFVRDLRDARRAIEELQEQNVYLQRSQEIDKQACETVKTSLVGLQEEVSDLQEQVAFYRGIVSPDASRAGVRVYELRVFPTGTSGLYRYDLVLIQSVRHDRRVAGRLDLRVLGVANGAPQTLRLTELGVAAPPRFSFKYFQEFGGELRLPAGFQPLRVQVEVQPDSGAEAVENEFEWSKILPTTPEG